MKLKEFVEVYGQPYSDMLGIDLKSKRNEDIVKWFLAAILYGKPIRENCATKTYHCFEKYGITTAKRIVAAGCDRLVSILDEGGYTRYDFSTADKLLEVFGNLEKLYDGDLTRLYKASKDAAELGGNLRKLGRGIGDTTVSIFLRDMRHIWTKVEPRATPLVAMAVAKLGVRDLERYAKKHRIDAVRLETALVRYSKMFLKRGRKMRIEI